MPWYATLAALVFFASAGAAIVPFRPFDNRRQALASAGCAFIVFAAPAPKAVPLADSVAATPKPDTAECLPADTVQASQKYSKGAALTRGEVELIAECYGLHVDAEASPARATASSRAAATIPVPTDVRARYFVIETGRLAGGNVTITSRREGPSGTTYARRECDCRSGRFRYLGEGQTLADARRSKVPPETMADLFTTGDGLGSISYHVCQYACGQPQTAAGRGKASAD